MVGQVRATGINIASVGTVPLPVQLSKPLPFYLNLSHLVSSNNQSRTWAIIYFRVCIAQRQAHEFITNFIVLFYRITPATDISIFQFPVGSLFLSSVRLLGLQVICLITRLYYYTCSGVTQGKDRGWGRNGSLSVGKESSHP